METKNGRRKQEKRMMRKKQKKKKTEGEKTRRRNRKPQSFENNIWQDLAQTAPYEGYRIDGIQVGQSQNPGQENLQFEITCKIDTQKLLGIYLDS